MRCDGINSDNKKKPRRSGVLPGLPDSITTRLGRTCPERHSAMQNEKKSPERGLISRGHTGSYLAGVQLENYPSTTLPRIAGITGTTPKSFFECDIDATTASVGDVGSTRLRL